MRDELANRLETNLQQQLILYKELRETAEKKQQALVANNIKELDAIVAREEVLIMQAAKLEKVRTAMAGEIARELHIPVEEVTLSRLTGEMPQLLPLQNEMEETIRNIQEKHALNTELLNQAMRIVEFSLNLFTRSDEKTYSRDLQKAEKETPGVKRSFVIDRSV